MIGLPDFAALAIESLLGRSLLLLVAEEQRLRLRGGGEEEE